MAIAKKQHESIFFKGRQWEKPVTCPSCSAPAERVEGIYHCSDSRCPFSNGYRLEPAGKPSQKKTGDPVPPTFLRAVPRGLDHAPDWSQSVPWPREEAP